jgi:hypothetical protein
MKLEHTPELNKDGDTLSESALHVETGGVSLKAIIVDQSETAAYSGGGVVMCHECCPRIHPANLHRAHCIGRDRIAGASGTSTYRPAARRGR